MFEVGRMRLERSDRVVSLSIEVPRRKWDAFRTQARSEEVGAK